MKVLLGDRPQKPLMRRVARPAASVLNVGVEPRGPGCGHLRPLPQSGIIRNRNIRKRGADRRWPSTNPSRLHRWIPLHGIMGPGQAAGLHAGEEAGRAES